MKMNQGRYILTKVSALSKAFSIEIKINSEKPEVGLS